MDSLYQICIHHLVDKANSVTGTASVAIISIFSVLLAAGFFRASRFLFKSLRSTSSLLAKIEPDTVPVPVSELTGKKSARVRVYVTGTELSTGAFTAGFLRPRIYLSPTLVENLDPSSLDIVIQHESGHVLRRDPLWFTIRRASAELLWFIPIIRLWLDRAILRSEILCDRIPVKNGYKSSDVARALLRIAEIYSSSERMAVAVSSIGDEIEFRIKALIGNGPSAPPRIKPALALASFILGLAIMGSFGTYWVHAADPGGFSSELSGIAAACDQGHPDGSGYEFLGIRCPMCSPPEDAPSPSLCNHQQ